MDQAHRHLEQRRVALLYPQVPEFEALRARLDALRGLWRRWADAWARDFNALCRAHGFLPGAAQQQRNLFDEVVRPMTIEAGTTAYFVVDALRYEMGEELYRQLADTPATTVHLGARLAELPTVTDIGMNALAPVATAGRLALALSGNGAIQGLSTGEFRVSDPETRKRAMQARVGGATCPWLTPFDAERLRAVALRLRELYPAADRAKLERAVSAAFIERLVAEVTAGSKGDVGVVPRQFLRELVTQLDLVDENEDHDPMADYGFTPAGLSPEEQHALTGEALFADDDGEALTPAEDAW